MERVTDEWLEQAWLDASKITQRPIPHWHMPRAFAQAVARECVKLLNDLQDENAETDYYTPTDCADRIRARFGLEE